jgi:hypothetical protein
LTVQASRILIKGDIQTLNAQIYRGAISISDNGTNGLMRNLISVDPSITFSTTIDDVVPNTHSLYISAASLTAATNSNVDFQQGVAAVGSLIPLLQWEVHSGMQDATPTAFMGAIAPGPTGTIMSNGTVLPSGSYSVSTAPFNNSITSGTGGVSSNAVTSTVAVQPTVTVAVQTMVIDRIVPTTVAPVVPPSATRSISNLLEAPLTAAMRVMALVAYERAFHGEAIESSVTVTTCENSAGKSEVLECEEI